MAQAQTIGGRYRVGELLGSGGMGTVYKGLDTDTGQLVAIKALKPQALHQDPDIIERFAREGEALRQLNHPNIVTMLAMVEEDGDHFLIMEYVGGGDLRDELEREGRLPVSSVLEIGLDLADALTRAHRLEIVHRDLKPANVLIAEDGTPRLTDFGAAHMGTKSRVTEQGTTLGTLDYLSPEAIKTLSVDYRADIWSFGVMLFQMLAGQHPFPGTRVWEVMSAILNDPTPDLEQMCPDAPVALVDLVYRMLMKDRSSRMSSVRLVGAELEAIMRGEDIGKLSTGEVQQAPKQAESRRFVTPTPPSGMLQHNIPAQAIPFVGRETELYDLAQLVEDSDVRIVTILAPGGMGKTRLALELASHILRVQRLAPLQDYSDFPNGIFFVPLAPLQAAEKIAPAIATALGFQFQHDARDPVRQILDYLREKQMLLIMDNFDHLLAGAGLISEILQTAPGVQIVVTSRERLHINEETLFYIGGMDVPEWETPENTDALLDSAEYSAVKLFVQSARRALPSFELEPVDLQYVVRICRLVEGNPLGILLAAAWVGMFSLKEIVDEINRSIDFLETDARNVPERHRSFRAVIESSWNQLTDDERVVIMKLSVFRGGFTRKSAQNVTGASLWTLATLVEKSFLYRDVETGRYDIHGLLHQYVDEQLAASGEMETAYSAHSRYYLQALYDCEPDIKGRDQLGVLNAIDNAFENIRLAWQWGVDHQDREAIDRAMECLDLFCHFRGRELDGVELFKQAREGFSPQSGEEPQPLWGRVLLRHHEDTYAPSPDPGPRIEQCLDIARHHDNQAEIGYCLIQLANAVGSAGERDEALALLKESQSHYQVLNDSHWIATIFSNMAFHFYEMGDRVSFLEYTHQSLNLARETGNKILVAKAMHNLGALAWFSGNYAEAEEHYRQSYALWREMGTLDRLAFNAANLFQLAFVKGDIQQARALADEAQRIWVDIHGPSVAERARSITIPLEILAENYSEARRLCEVQRPFVAARTDTLMGLEWRVALASCGLRDYPTAYRSMHAALDSAVILEATAFKTFCLPVAAIIAAHEGESDRATELLALAFAHPKSATGWMEEWPLFSRLRDDLQRKLGKERYETALEQGKSLDLDAVVRELLAKKA